MKLPIQLHMTWIEAIHNLGALMVIVVEAPINIYIYDMCESELRE